MFLIAFSILLFLLIFFLVMLYYVLKYGKQMKKNDSQLKHMQKTIANLEAKLLQTRSRKTYRIPLPQTECEFELVQTEKQFDDIERKKGFVRDISITGLRFESNDDLPIKESLKVKMFFKLQDVPFEITGKVIRKDEYFDKTMISYGVNFLKTKDFKEAELYRLIREIELRNK